MDFRISFAYLHFSSPSETNLHGKWIFLLSAPKTRALKSPTENLGWFFFFPRKSRNNIVLKTRLIVPQKCFIFPSLSHPSLFFLKCNIDPTKEGWEGGGKGELGGFRSISHAKSSLTETFSLSVFQYVTIEECEKCWKVNDFRSPKKKFFVYPVSLDVCRMWVEFDISSARELKLLNHCIDRANHI